MTNTTFQFFAAVPPGLEDIANAEIKALAKDTKIVPGGVEFTGDLKLLFLANLLLRVPSRILLRVAHFRVKDFNGLIAAVSKYPWEIYLSQGVPIKIRVTSKKSKLWHSEAVKERIYKGIERRLKQTVKIIGNQEQIDPSHYQLIVCRLNRDICSLKVDTSGDFLFHRGYKLIHGPAPLRENLAAAIIKASKWDKLSPFLDPFAGSGTIPIEAALIAHDIPPGLNRSYPFERWKIFDSSLWKGVKKEVIGHIKDIAGDPKIIAQDVDEKMLKALRENARKALGAYCSNLGDMLEVRKASFEKTLPPVKGPGWIVTNPPFGKRLFCQRDEAKFLLSIKEHLLRHYKGWKVFLLVPSEYERLLNNRLERPLRFRHGGLKVSLVQLTPYPQ